MELGPAWQDLGLWGLFLASFLAATVLPFSSEAVLAAMTLGPWPAFSLWLCASAGNWAGGMSSYALGRLVDQRRVEKWLGVPAHKVEGWEARVRRWGSWTALITWMPVIGDVVAVALGVFRLPIGPVGVLMFVGKAARYAVVLWVLRG